MLAGASSSHPRILASSFGPQCLLREKDQAPRWDRALTTLWPRSCIISGNTKANVCTDRLDFQMLCFPKFSLSQMRFPCGAPGGHGERSMSVKKALHENAAFCISCLWEQLKTNLIVFGGLPWGLCRQEYGKAPTRDLASIINF